MEEYSTPPEARGLLSGTDIMIPIRQESKDIGLSPPKIIVSVATAQSGPTEEVLGSSNPLGKHSASPDLSGAGLTTFDLPGEDSTLSDPWGSDPLLGVEHRSQEGPTPP
jgi:hypothetical protein